MLIVIWWCFQVKQEELLQFAQCAISGLKVNAEQSRLSNKLWFLVLLSFLSEQKKVFIHLFHLLGANPRYLRTGPRIRFLVALVFYCPSLCLCLELQSLVVFLTYIVFYYFFFPSFLYICWRKITMRLMLENPNLWIYIFCCLHANVFVT